MDLKLPLGQNVLNSPVNFTGGAPSGASAGALDRVFFGMGRYLTQTLRCMDYTPSEGGRN